MDTIVVALYVSLAAWGGLASAAALVAVPPAAPSPHVTPVEAGDSERPQLARHLDQLDYLGLDYLGLDYLDLLEPLSIVQRLGLADHPGLMQLIAQDSPIAGMLEAGLRMALDASQDPDILQVLTEGLDSMEFLNGLNLTKVLEPVVGQMGGGEGWSQSARVIYDAVTKNQVSVPLGDGSLGSVVGPLVFSALVGLLLWGAVTTFLSQATNRRRDPGRRGSLLEELATSVHKGITRHANAILPDAPRHPHVSYHAHHTHYDPLAYNTRYELDESVMGSSQPEELLEPVRDVTAIRIPVTVLASRFPNRRGEAEEEVTVDNPNNIPLHGAVPVPMPVTVPVSVSVLQRGQQEHQVRQPQRPWDNNPVAAKPFARPGSFINPNRQGQAPDVTYYYERPRPEDRRPKVTSSGKKDVTYYYERPPQVSRKVNRSRGLSSQRHDDTYYFEDPHGNGPPRPVVPPGRPSRPKNDVTYFYEVPPLALLNPKPNTWRGGTDTHAFGTSTSSWNRKKESAKGTPAMARVETTTSAPRHTFPPTITPQSPSTSRSSMPLEDANVSELLALLSGVPVRWMPEGTDLKEA